MYCVHICIHKTIYILYNCNIVWHSVVYVHIVWQDSGSSNLKQWQATLWLNITHKNQWNVYKFITLVFDGFSQKCPCWLNEIWIKERSVKTIEFVHMCYEELLMKEKKLLQPNQVSGYTFFLIYIYMYKILFHLKKVLCTNVSVNECGADMWIKEWVLSILTKNPEIRSKDRFSLFLR